jgi:hypothetical protein
VVVERSRNTAATEVVGVVEVTQCFHNQWDLILQM